MRLSIENIGCVKKAELALNGITIVAGSNASGKSTISKSLYAILNSFYELPQNARRQRIRSINRVLLALLKTSDDYGWLDIAQATELRNELRKVLLGKKLESDTFLYHIQHILNSYSIEDCTKKDIEELYKSYEEILKNGLNYYENYTIQIVLDNIFYKQVNNFRNLNEGKIVYDNGKTHFSLSIKENKLSDFKTAKSITSKLRPIYITTSDLMDSVGSYKKLYSAQKSGGVSYMNLNLTNLLMEETPSMERTAEEYQTIEQQKQFFHDILNQIVDGKICMEDRQLVYHDNWYDTNIEFANIASGMKIFIILKRLIENGVLLGEQIIIIDEPETNLHPEWQLKLAELLVLLYKTIGIRIYANSHSPYFVRAMEYYADKHQILDKANFYFMQQIKCEHLFVCEDATDQLGTIYDCLAEPFNQIM